MLRSKVVRSHLVRSAVLKGCRADRRALVEMLENRTLLSALTVSTTADVVDGGDGVLSLREAILIANDNTGATSYDGISSTDVADAISFDLGTGSQTIVLNGSELPAITQDLTITGPGADLLTIDANQKSRIFEIRSGEAELNGLTLTGGRASNGDNGGGILNEGTLSVSDSTVSGNWAYSNYGDGGGIYSFGALTVTDSTISGNRAYGDDSDGGGIYNNGVLRVIDSTVSGNTASNGHHSRGGGVYNNGVLAVVGSTINDNSANDYGGGIASFGGLSITDSEIRGNFAGDGGGIYVYIGFQTLVVANCTLMANWGRGVGGAIYNEGGRLSVTGSTISSNLAGNGGGIFSDGALSVMDSAISDNSADNAGGGIYNAGTLKMTSSTIDGNSTTPSYGEVGGGIYNRGTVALTGCAIAANRAGYAGGGIYNDRGTMAVKNSTASGNSAWLDGGGIYNYRGTVTVMNSTIAGNRVNHAGGGIYTYLGTLLVTGCTLTANRVNSHSSEFRGAGLAGSADSVTMNNTIVAGNVGDSGVLTDNILWDSGTFPAASHNLIGDAATSGGITDGVNGNIVGVSDLTTVFIDVNHDGMINGNDLADNGGPTETYALAPLSPAINGGDDSLVPAGVTTDQRGAGYGRFAGTVDIGAVEEQSPTVSNLTVKTDENIAVMLSADVFDGGCADAENDPLAAVRIDSLPADGVLLVDGQAVVAGEIVSRAELAGLVYQPGENFSGNDSFAFSASDGISFAEADATLTVAVLTPGQAASDLLARLRGLNLSHNMEMSLGAKLDSVDGLLGGNHNSRAVLAQLDAFIKGVNHWAEKGLIGADDQAGLVSAAQLIEESILSGAV